MTIQIGKRTVAKTTALRVLAAATVLSVLFAGGVLFWAVTTNKTDIDAGASTDRANCAVNQAIIDAGISALKSGVLLPGDSLDETGRFIPGRLTKQLVGFPSYPERVASAKKAADAYEAKIATAVAKAIGTKLANNKLDCSRIVR